MTFRLYALAASLLVASITPAAGAPSYVGTWNVNVAKSQLSGDTVTLSRDSAGTMTFDGQGFKYSFKPDGKEYPLPDGGTASWNQSAANIWNVAIKSAGRLLITYRIAVEGETMTLAGKLTKPDGTVSDMTAAYKRTTAGSGLVGKWMSTEVNPPFSRLEIAVAAPDGVTITDDTGGVFSGQFDGNVTPALGRLKGSKYSTTFRKAGANSFELNVSVDGKPMYREVYSVSAGSKTLTIDGTPVNAPTEKYKVVFERR